MALGTKPRLRSRSLTQIGRPSHGTGKSPQSGRSAEFATIDGCAATPAMGGGAGKRLPQDNRPGLTELPDAKTETERAGLEPHARRDTRNHVHFIEVDALHV